jgi:DNA-directed RNA polymerase subunit K/omega
MDETPDTLDPLDTVAEAAAPPGPRPKAPPIGSRFLFVDVAALRAKQLRRGAMPRLDEPDGSDRPRLTLFKPERVAMEEVSRGLVLYELPAFKHAES